MENYELHSCESDGLDKCKAVVIALLHANNKQDAVEFARQHGWSKGLRCAICKKASEIIKKTVTIEKIC